MQFDNGIDDLLTPLKQRIKAIEEENQSLKAQLAQARQELENLRRGVGIVVTIDGKPVLAGGQAGTQTTMPYVLSMPSSGPLGPTNTPPFGTPVASTRPPNLFAAPNNPTAAGALCAGLPAVSPPDSRENSAKGKSTGYTDFFLD